MIWLAFRAGDFDLGSVEAGDLDTAWARARAKWGVSVERVQSKVSWEIVVGRVHEDVKSEAGKGLLSGTGR